MGSLLFAILPKPPAPTARRPVEAAILNLIKNLVNWIGIDSVAESPIHFCRLWFPWFWSVAFAAGSNSQHQLQAKGVLK